MSNTTITKELVVEYLEEYIHQEMDNPVILAMESFQEAVYQFCKSNSTFAMPSAERNFLEGELNKELIAKHLYSQTRTIFVHGQKFHRVTGYVVLQIAQSIAKEICKYHQEGVTPEEFFLRNSQRYSRT